MYSKLSWKFYKYGANKELAIIILANSAIPP